MGWRPDWDTVGNGVIVLVIYGGAVWILTTVLNAIAKVVSGGGRASPWAFLVLGLLFVGIVLFLVRQYVWRLVKWLGGMAKGLYVGLLSDVLARPVREELAIALFGRYEQGTMIFSGEVGEFSDPNGPWSRSVACIPFPAWPREPHAKWLWIRDKPTDEEAKAGQWVWHRREFWLLRDPSTVSVAKLWLRVDDKARVFVNGKPLGEFRGWERHEVVIANCLRRGKNELRMEIWNDAIAGSTGSTNPSGVVYGVEIG